MTYTKRLDSVENTLKSGKTRPRLILIKHGDEVDAAFVLNAGGAPPYRSLKRRPDESEAKFLQRTRSSSQLTTS